MKEIRIHIICRTPRGKPIGWAVHNGEDFVVVQSPYVKNEWADYEDWVQLSFDFIL